MYYTSTVSIATVRDQYWFYLYLRIFSEKWTECTIVYLTIMIFLFLLFLDLNIFHNFFSNISNLCSLCILCHNLLVSQRIP